MNGSHRILTPHGLAFVVLKKVFRALIQQWQRWQQGSPGVVLLCMLSVLCESDNSTNKEKMDCSISDVGTNDDPYDGNSFLSHRWIKHLDTKEEKHIEKAWTDIYYIAGFLKL